MDDTKIPKTLLSWWRWFFSLSSRPKNSVQLLRILRLAEEDNLIDVDSLNMIEGVMQISAMQVRDIMIPRRQMIVINETQTLDQVISVVSKSGHSRFPVENSDHEKVIGVLLAKDLLNCQLNQYDVHQLMRPAIFTPLSKRLNVLLREFKAIHNHIAIVVDEYGVVAGLVTIEDVIEQIVGDIEDEYDLSEEIYIKQHSDRQYTIKAITPISIFNQRFQVNFDEDKVETVAGLIIQKLGYLPNCQDLIDIGKFRFKILRSDRRRIYLLSMDIRTT